MGAGPAGGPGGSAVARATRAATAELRAPFYGANSTNIINSCEKAPAGSGAFFWPLPVGGNQLFTIGDFSGGGGTCTGGIYALKTLRSQGDRIPTLTADAQGRLWFFIGTDSGFESRTEIYYLEGSVTFTPV